MLQLGYFSQLENAQAYRESLTAVGIEAQVVAQGEPGLQYYQVISGSAEQPSHLENLNTHIEALSGARGYAVRSPFESTPAADLFTGLKPQYLLAQAAPPVGTEGAAPMRVSGYDPGLNRTPQEEIDSMPGFTVGGMPIIPTLGLSLGYDDNITRASRDEIESWFYMISPAIRVELPSDRSVLSLIAAADIVRYEDSPVDDRDTWYLRGDWTYDISQRQNLGLFAEYREGADRRGEGRRQGDAGLVPIDPDEWERFGYGGTWDYGAVGARGRLTIDAGAWDLEYTNNREGLTPDDPGTTALDRDWWYAGGTFFWRVAPKTSLLADYRYTDMNYKTAVDSDSEIHTWALGVTWEASARTTGRIQYGNQKRKFADPTKEDYNGPAWMASVTWRPRTYSLFTLQGTRSTQEPNGNGDYVLRQDITLSWLHDWNDRFGTHVDVGYGEDDYRPNGRTEDLFYWGVGGRYAFNQHFRFGASLNGYDRDSADPEFDYKRMVFLLTLEASF
ncbi:MAG: outer membrane beta-barrel protein [Xanthomonadales bacterium]|nr:outer membrane beta-barrel protein [Xanthomonadales bacterium]